MARELNPVKVALMKAFGWQRCATLTSDNDIYISVRNNERERERGGGREREREERERRERKKRENRERREGEREKREKRERERETTIDVGGAGKIRSATEQIFVPERCKRSCPGSIGDGENNGL